MEGTLGGLGDGEMMKGEIELRGWGWGGEEEWRIIMDESQEGKMAERSRKEKS